MKDFLIEFIKGAFFLVYTLLLFFGGYNFHKKFNSNTEMLRKEFQREISQIKQEYIELPKTEQKSETPIVNIDQSNILKDLNQIKKDLILINKNQKCSDSLANLIHEEIGILHKDIVHLEGLVKTNKKLIKKKKSHYINSYAQTSCDKNFLRSLWVKYCSKKQKEYYSKDKFKIPFLSNMCSITKEEFVKKECSLRY